MVCLYILIISYADFPSNKMTLKSMKNKKKNTLIRIFQPILEQTSQKIEFEITSKPMPRRSPRLTPKILDVQFSYDERVPKKEPLVIKITARKLKQGVKNTWLAAWSKKNNRSEYTNMFTMFTDIPCLG